MNQLAHLYHQWVSSETLLATTSLHVHRQRAAVSQLSIHAHLQKLHVELQLQVQSPSSDIWQPVTLGANQVAVFAGETLQHATAGRIPAAVHRVFLDPAATNQAGVRCIPRL